MVKRSWSFSFLPQVKKFDGRTVGCDMILKRNTKTRNLSFKTKKCRVGIFINKTIDVVEITGGRVLKRPAREPWN